MSLTLEVETSNNKIRTRVSAREMLLVSVKVTPTILIKKKNNNDEKKSHNNDTENFNTSPIPSTQNNLGLLQNESVDSNSGSAMSHRELDSHRNMLERDNQFNFDQDD